MKLNPSCPIRRKGEPVHLIWGGIVDIKVGTREDIAKLGREKSFSRGGGTSCKERLIASKKGV